MSDFQAIGSLFTPDGALRMLNIPVELEGWDEIRAWGERVPTLVDYFVQTTHPDLNHIRLLGREVLPQLT